MVLIRLFKLIRDIFIIKIIIIIIIINIIIFFCYYFLIDLYIT